ncbi:uncharacterized protein [Palaemon carinicauda]|uniref:uncharacterized protein n=1 Tax=Palaemon carinicauda TaxID=392227 RepID=UPI0035B5E27F
MIKRGIFQGDSLSLLLFWLTIDPFSKILNYLNTGYDLNKSRGGKDNERVNHLFFMHDLKLYADLEEKLEELVRIFHRFSSYICMEFGLDNCAKITMNIRKKVTLEGIEV